jgi:hypothetical protein
VKKSFFTCWGKENLPEDICMFGGSPEPNAQHPSGEQELILNMIPVWNHHM